MQGLIGKILSVGKLTLMRLFLMISILIKRRCGFIHLDILLAVKGINRFFCWSLVLIDVTGLLIHTFFYESLNYKFVLPFVFLYCNLI